jgi:hypothetical protein
MSTKSDYGSEEWVEVVAGPYFSALYIVVADPNFAYFKEISAMTRAMLDSAAKTANDLIKAISTDLSAKDTQEEIRRQFEAMKEHKDPGALNAAIVAKLTGAADIVTAEDEDDGQAYRNWLLYLAEATAEGSKEGGVLGIGAVRVSDKERQGLDELASALGVSAAS